MRLAIAEGPRVVGKIAAPILILGGIGFSAFYFYYKIKDGDIKMEKLA